MAQTKNEKHDPEILKRHPSVISVYAARVPELRRLGAEYKGRCPFPGHPDSTPSFTIWQPSDIWLYKCQGCGVSGNVLQLVEKIDGISFVQAMEKVNAELGNPSNKAWFKSGHKVDKTFKAVDLNGGGKPKISYSLEEYAQRERDLANGELVQKWLMSRGITLATAQALRFGFKQKINVDPNGDNVDIADKGWITFPCIENDRVVSIKYRSIARKAFSKVTGMSTALFNTRDIDAFAPIYVVEGEMDAAALKQIGKRVVSIPSGSTRLTPGMKDQLKAAQCIVLAGDNEPGKIGTKVMEELWAALGDDVFLLTWPDGIKDANQALQEDPKSFPALVESLTALAMSTPMPGINDMVQVLKSARDGVNPKDHPDRLRFPWKVLDEMAIIMPGSVIFIYAEITGTGKSSLVLQSTLWNAMTQGDVVLNHQCELSVEDVAKLITAQQLRKHRLEITAEDQHKAAAMLGNCVYYVGRDQVSSRADEVINLLEAAIQRLSPTILVIDHVHFICRNESNQIQAQENAMRRLINLAHKYKLKVILVGQPSKTNRDQRRGKGSDNHIHNVKGSEAFTSDSHAVFFMSRKPKKDADSEQVGELDPVTIITRQKARVQGPGPGVGRLYCRGEYGLFTDISMAEK